MPAKRTRPALAAAAVGVMIALGVSTAALATGAQPAIEETSVTKVTSHSARLHALIDPNGAKTEYSFFVEWKLCQGQGVCPELWKQIEVSNGTIRRGQSAVSVSTRVELTPGCAYEYHVVATNRYGRSHTNEMPGDREKEFVTKSYGRLPEPHQCEAGG